MAHRNNDKLEFNKTLTCTWDTDADCFNCLLDKDLDWKWDLKHIIRFYRISMPFFIPVALGMILTGLWTGNWIGLIIYGIFWVIFFCFFEIWSIVSSLSLLCGRRKSTSLFSESWFTKSMEIRTWTNE